MKKVITFGEIMIRLNPEGYQRFWQAESFEASYAGGEANVAVAVANYGLSAEFVTKLPDNDIGQSAINALRRYGVETGQIVRGGPRIGLYYIEKGASQRPSKVIYDRAGSSIALAKRSDFDWHKIFTGASWFHFTGITPALGGENPEICLDACKAAKEMGLTVSCDLNYRKKLWTSEEAGRTMAKLMPYVDLCIANEADAADVFGIQARDTDVEGGELNHAGYVDVAKQLCQRFGFKRCAITLRGSISASDNIWAAMLYENGTAYFSPSYRVHLVDRVGGGDSFGGALIYALMEGYEAQEAINFAVAGSCLKQTIQHDFSLVSLKEAASLAAGNASGRIQR